MLITNFCSEFWRKDKRNYDNKANWKKLLIFNDFLLMLFLVKCADEFMVT